MLTRGLIGVEGVGARELALMLSRFLEVLFAFDNIDGRREVDVELDSDDVDRARDEIVRFLGGGLPLDDIVVGEATVGEDAPRTFTSGSLDPSCH